MAKVNNKIAPITHVRIPPLLHTQRQCHREENAAHQDKADEYGSLILSAHFYLAWRKHGAQTALSLSPAAGLCVLKVSYSAIRI